MTNTSLYKRFISFTAAALALTASLVPFLANAANAAAPNSPAAAGTSLNWAGYETTGGTYTSVGASWMIPQSTAPSTPNGNSISADATWVGIGGVSTRDLIQAGTQTVFQNGTPTYEAWYELLPSDSQQIPLTVHPGDAMTVSIAQQSNGLWNIYFFDSTTGQSYTTSVSYQSALSSAEWVEEMPSMTNGYVALDNFGTASFASGFTVENGTQLSLAGANAQPLTMINNAGESLATPSALGADGASFSITRSSVTSAVTPEIVVGRTGRWSRTGVGVQGYTAPSRTLRSGYGYFRISFGNFPVMFRSFVHNFRDARDR